MTTFKIGQSVDFIREVWEEEWVYGRKESCHVGYDLADGRVVNADDETVVIAPDDRKRLVFVSPSLVFAKDADGRMADEARTKLKAIELENFPDHTWKF
jgi:hypothetical protein